MAKELTSKEALGLIGSQSEALTRYLDHRCVGLVGFQGDQPNELGSGTCISIGGRFFIATAAHVIDGFANDDLFLIHTREPNDVQIPIIARGARGGGDNDPEDVAWLELDASSAAALNKTFVEATHLRPSVAELTDDNALVYGYPEEKIDRALLRSKQLRVQPIGYLTPTIAATTVGHHASFDLCLEYPEKDNLLTSGEPLQRLPAAPGISGGGVWTTGASEPGLWAADKCRLIAIEHAWLPYKYLRCTQIQHWLDLLATDLPDLKPAIDAILAGA